MKGKSQIITMTFIVDESASLIMNLVKGDLNLAVHDWWSFARDKSPIKDFGYDVQDYRAMNSMFGTIQDFESILETAH